MSTQKPNMIYIFADDMGFGDMKSNNPSSKIPTPNLDRLVQQGMRFTDAHAPSSVCTPSRYALLTGRYCWRTQLQKGVLWPWDPPLIEDNQRTVAELLQDHGYNTACIGKWHLGWEWPTLDGERACKGTELGVNDKERRGKIEHNIDYTKPIRGGPVDHGFDSYFGVDVPNFPPYTWFEGDRLTDQPTEEKPEEIFGWAGLMKPGWKHEAMIPAFVERAVNYISDAGPEPFFLYFPLTSPHTPIAPNEEFIGQSGAGRYGDFVCEVDWVVGQVMDALDRKGIADDTLLIFTSDNGPEPNSAAAGGSYEHIRQFRHYSMGELRGVKRDAWEGGHRVPFVARWPRVTPGGTECHQLTTLGDLMATCADIIGSDLPENDAPDSVSILPLLEGKTDTVVRDFAVHHSASGNFAIRKGRWVYIDAPSGDDNNKEPDWFKHERGYKEDDYPGELFDLKHDIAERKNLYADYPDVVNELSNLLEQVKENGERHVMGKR